MMQPQNACKRSFYNRSSVAGLRRRFPQGEQPDEVASSNFHRAAIARFELEETEEGIGYVATLYLLLFTTSHLRSGLETPHTPHP